MAKLLSDQTAEELPEIFEAVRNMSQATRGRPIRRDRGGGGGAERPYIIITEVTDPANYVGNVLGGPADLGTIVEEDVAIQIIDATANELVIGFKSFSDVVDDVYYLEGALLG